MPGFQPSPASASPEAKKENPGVKLPCILFLKAYFDRGRVNQNGFDMLYRMIELISATGWEVHLMYQSKIATSRSVERVELSMDCVLQGCNVFYTNMEKASIKAKEAGGRLPVLEQSDETLQTKLTQWHWKLKTMHNPIGDDRRLFKMVLDHYDTVFERIKLLNERKPFYGLSKTIDRATEVRNSLGALVRLAREANRSIRTLLKDYQAGVELLAEREANKIADGQRVAVKNHLTAAKYQITDVEKGFPTGFSKSFGVAEEQAARKRQDNTADTGYITVLDRDDHMEKGSRTQGPTIGHRRRGTSTPRTFTESLSELESGVHKLKLHKVRTPEMPEHGKTSIATHDFGTAQSDSHSPPQPLQRREALVSKETELQDRMIKGELISSRRPSTKEKSSAPADLDAWNSHEASRLPDFPDFDYKTGKQMPH